MRDRRGKNLDSFIDHHNRNFASYLGSSVPDVHPGKELIVTISSIGSKGDGIAKYKSYTVFVPDVKVNDKLTVIVKSVRNNLLFAQKA